MTAVHEFIRVYVFRAPSGRHAKPIANARKEQQQ